MSRECDVRQGVLATDTTPVNLNTNWQHISTAAPPTSQCYDVSEEPRNVKLKFFLSYFIFCFDCGLMHFYPVSCLCFYFAMCKGSTPILARNVSCDLHIQCSPPDRFSKCTDLRRQTRRHTFTSIGTQRRDGVSASIVYVASPRSYLIQGSLYHWTDADLVDVRAVNWTDTA